MEDYNKIIESLGVKFVRASNVNILQPITVNNFYNVENTVILLRKGTITFGQENTRLKEGEILFVPSGKAVSIHYGGDGDDAVTNNDMSQNMDKFFKTKNTIEIASEDEQNFCYISLNANVFESVNFFQSLDIPPFVISKAEGISNILLKIIDEQLQERPGKERIIKVETERLVIEVFRYIIEHKLFVEQLATNITYFKDPRLLDIFQFINENISGDLSNKVLASVANVSEDYVGQYFKMLTGINPQDYIEYQRMEIAVNLLRTTKKSIRDIGKDVGYKDTAYFCRRFKMMFGIPAGKMRRRESLMNI